MSQMDEMTQTELEGRYGPMVSLETLAGYFHARVRALQAALRREQITIYEFGDDRMVALRAVEAKFGLIPVKTDDEAIAHNQARWQATHRDDGSPKPADEYLAELRAETPALVARIEAARREQRDRNLVATA